jgi:predicted dinucleotide-utilizing enzyme
VELIAGPELTMNAHRIVAGGEFGRTEIKLENRPLAA